MEEQKSQFDRVKEITDQLEEGIANLFESDAFKQYLTTLSKFHNYSLNNTLLIAMQKPDATLVAGYTAWQKQFGRQVQKGEKAIKILAPTPYKKKVNVEKQDPNTGEVLRNPDGTAQTEIQEVMQSAFKIVNVFDISSTEGKELPTIGVDVLWSSIFVTLMANKIGGLQFGIYRNCQISSRVFHTAVAALPLTKANRSDFE
ncbi:ArdC family protein [Mediterraneibacter gnavus]|uniref:ArdC family protein n=1 Tax=Mediterraneibacter gnavus TaxID=33038 RepID=UPI0036D35921